MKKLVFSDYESLSNAAAQSLLQQTKKNPALKICLATGSSPTRSYEIYAELVKAQNVSMDRVHVIKLDEWGGLPANHPASCESYIRKHFNEAHKISSDRYLAFRGDAEDRDSECARVREELERIGPVDVSVLGLGLNGHLGLNEPAESLQPFSHIATLTAESQQHSMIASEGARPSFGYTMGMAELLQSRLVIMLVSGSKKKEQLKRLLNMKVDPQFPSSFLWLHPNVELYCDEAAHG